MDEIWQSYLERQLDAHFEFACVLDATVKARGTMTKEDFDKYKTRLNNKLEAARTTWDNALREEQLLADRITAAA